MSVRARRAHAYHEEDRTQVVGYFDWSILSPHSGRASPRLCDPASFLPRAVEEIFGPFSPHRCEEVLSMITTMSSTVEYCENGLTR